MSTLEAILLGIIQGITEFFPISSSGHLALGQYLLGFKDLHNYIFFDLVCHLGTLSALICVFFADIKSLFKANHQRLQQIVIGTLPLFPLVLLMKPIKALFDTPEYLGYCFLFTAFLLYLGIRAGNSSTAVQSSQRPWRDAMIIGMFQAVAILPGVSRSGATISAGRLLDWPQKEALTFSFLLAIPAILGGITLESLHLIRMGDMMSTLPAIGWVQYASGFLSSLIIGYLALRILVKVAAKDKFMYFVWYCLLIGVASIFYFSL